MRRRVARSARAWIETYEGNSQPGSPFVARSARAWIETKESLKAILEKIVARSARAWIETPVKILASVASVSHALRVRGLKPDA